MMHQVWELYSLQKNLIFIYNIITQMHDSHSDNHTGIKNLLGDKQTELTHLGRYYQPVKRFFW